MRFVSAAFRQRLARIFVCIAVAVTVLAARVRDVRSDPRATLVAAQVLLRHGTFALDSLGPERLRGYGYAVAEKSGHFYSTFPFGSTLVALPVVALATAAGVDFGSYENERLFQVLLAAGVAVGCVLLLTSIARLWFETPVALALAAASWFGSSFASTEATALWSHDFATLFALVAIFMVLSAAERGSALFGYGVGLALFGAYLCRPTLSLLTPALLALLFARDRRAALKAGLLVALCLGLFALWSERTFGEPLPDYYLPQRLVGGHYLTALAGNLVSPSRGLLVFSPIFLLPLLFWRDAGRALGAAPRFILIAVVWPLVHLLVVSHLDYWWAGYSFGPRYMTDVLPGLFVLLCVTLRALLERKPRLAWPVFGLLAAVSAAINTGQGLYEHAPKAWNAAPSIDEYPELLFDWRYPQFLNTEVRQRARVSELRARGIEVSLAPRADDARR